MALDKDNYFSEQANMEYLSASQFKDFMKCEVEALAKIKEPDKPTTAMLIGSYVDSYFSGELDTFKEQNPQIFKKDGTLLKDFEKANEIIQVIENDDMLMEYLSGEHQVIMTGFISGVPFKIKIDSLLKNIIVDQKIMSSIYNLEWKQDNNGQWRKVDFVEMFGYDIQGAIYQEIVRQNTGIRMPFVLAVTTKEDNPDKALIQIDQYYLDRALKVVEDNCQRFDLIKKGVIEPVGCGHCATCRKDRQVTQVFSYETLFNKERNDNEQRD